MLNVEYKIGPMTIPETTYYLTCLCVILTLVHPDVNSAFLGGKICVRSLGTQVSRVR